MGSGEHDPRYGVSGFVPLTGHNLAYPGPTGPSSSYEVSSGNFSRGGVGRGFVYPGGATAGLTWESERRQWSEAVMLQVRGFSRTDEWGRAASQQDSHVGIQFRREEGGVGRLGGPGPSLAAGQPSFGVMFEGQRSVDTMGNVGHGLVGRSGMEEGRGGDRGSGYGLVPSRGQGEDSSGGFRSSEVGQSSAFVGAGGVTDPYRGGTVNRESSAHVGLGSLGHSGRQDPSWLGRDSVQPRAPVMSSAVSRGPAGDPALGAMMLMEVSQAEVEAARNKLRLTEQLLLQMQAAEGVSDEAFAAMRQRREQERQDLQRADAAVTSMTLGNRSMAAVGSFTPRSVPGVSPGGVTDCDGVVFVDGITNKEQARTHLRWTLFYRRLASPSMVLKLCSGEDWKPDLSNFKRSFDPDFTNSLLSGGGMLDPVALGQLKELPVWKWDWMTMMLFTGRAFYLNWFVRNEKIPDTIPEIVAALRDVEFAYMVLFGNPAFKDLFKVFTDQMRQTHLDFVTPEFWRVWLEDCLFRVNRILSQRYDWSQVSSQVGRPGAPQQLVSISPTGAFQYHAVELMRLMIGRISEVVMVPHFRERFASQLTRMRDELKNNHIAYRQEIGTAFPLLKPPEGVAGGSRGSTSGSGTGGASRDNGRRIENAGGTEGTGNGNSGGSSGIGGAGPLRGGGFGRRGDGSPPRDAGFHDRRSGRWEPADRYRHPSPFRDRKRQRSPSPQRRRRDDGDDRDRGRGRELDLRERENAVAKRERELKEEERKAKEREDREREKREREREERDRARRERDDQRELREQRERQDRERNRREAARARSPPRSRSPVVRRSERPPMRAIPDTLCRHALLHLLEFPGARLCDNGECGFSHPTRVTEVSETVLRKFLRTVRLTSQERGHVKQAFETQFPDLNTAPPAAGAAAGGV